MPKLALYRQTRLLTLSIAILFTCSALFSDESSYLQLGRNHIGLQLFGSLPAHRTFSSEYTNPAPSGFYYFPSISINYFTSKPGLRGGSLKTIYPTAAGNVGFGISYLETDSIYLLSGSLGLGRAINKHWSLGLSFESFLSGDSDYILALHPGLAWRMHTASRISSGFGFHQIEWEITPSMVGIGRHDFSPGFFTGIGIHFFNYKAAQFKLGGSVETDPFAEFLIWGTSLEVKYSDFALKMAKLHNSEQISASEGYAVSFGYRPAILSNWNASYTFLNLVQNENVHKIGLSKSFFEVSANAPFVSCDVKEPVFSPNGDSSKDSLLVQIDIENNNRIVSWQAAFKSEDGKYSRKFRQSILRLEKELLLSDVPSLFFANRYYLTIPRSLTWDGRVFDQESPDTSTIPQKQAFSFQLTLEDEFGNQTQCEINNLRIDNEKPKAQIALRNNYFNLYNNEEPSAIIELQNAQSKDVVEISVLNEKRQRVYTYETTKSKFNARFSWNGRSTEKKIMPAGNYTIQVQVFDEAGNKSIATSPPFFMQTKKTRLDIYASQNLFSQNAGPQEVEVRIQSLDPEKFKSWAIKLKNSKDKQKTLLAKDGPLPGFIKLPLNDFSTSGISQAQVILQLIAVDENEEISSSNDLQITIDSRSPLVNLAVNRETDDFLKNDMLFLIANSIQESGTVASYQLTIEKVTKDLELVYSIQNIGHPPPVFSWNGGTLQGKNVHSFETLDAKLRVIDEAGNTGQSRSTRFQTGLIIEPEFEDPTFIFESILFAPNQDYVFSTEFEKLSRLAEFLKEYKNNTILLKVYCNQQISPKENLALSEKRAKWLYDWLSKTGVKENRIQYAGRGSLNDRGINAELDSVVITLLPKK